MVAHAAVVVNEALVKTILIIATAILAAATGFKAAWEWWKSSKIQTELGYTYPGACSGETYVRHGIERVRGFEPLDEDQKLVNEVDATWDAMSRASKLNTIAAQWTAASVALSALCSILGAVV